MNIRTTYPLLLEDSSMGYRFMQGAKRSLPVLLVGALFERSVSTLFVNPVVGLGGLAATYCLREVMTKEVEQIRSEYLASSRLSNMVRFQLPFLGITIPLLTLKATGANLSCQAIATLFFTSVSLISPIIERHQWQIDEYILSHMGIHVSNLANGDRCKNVDQIRAHQRTIESEKLIPLLQRIKELNKQGVYLSENSSLVISEVFE